MFHGPFKRQAEYIFIYLNSAKENKVSVYDEDFGKDHIFR